MAQEVNAAGVEDSDVATAFLPLVGCRRLKSFSFCIWNRGTCSAAILDGLQLVHTWGCQGIEQLFLDVTPPEEEGKQEGAASVEETFMDGPVLGWSLCPKQAVVTMSYVLKMQKGFFEDLFESVQSLEHLRVLEEEEEEEEEKEDKADEERGIKARMTMMSTRLAMRWRLETDRQPNELPLDGRQLRRVFKMFDRLGLDELYTIDCGGVTYMRVSSL
ncbi:hypothetical protein BGZ97_000864 [Linnemannia gamsii]|uniref:Uncharacterized protein n=1 Tax=Linnemannia gamsii TaxID=64522 RepID=A0A9P6R294_9FUNG|nr:hypothetical protein BGZ97_000864 [Linnemannia gamsii]